MSENRQTRLGLAALALVGFAFYLPALSGRYVFLDDYSYFYHGPQHEGWYVKELNRSGRPLTGLYLRLCHALVEHTGGPDLAHLPGLLGVLLLGLATFAWLRLQRVRTAPAFLLCVVLLTLPSTLLCVAYINCGSYGWGALAAALALLTFAPALLRPTMSWTGKLLLGAAAWVLLLTGMFLYQPSALYYWALATAALLCAPCPDWPTFRGRAGPLLVLGLASMAGYFAAYKTYFWALGLAPLPRGELTGDVGGKLAWFWGEPLHNALSLWQLPATHERFSRNVLLLILAGAAADLLGGLLRRSADGPEAGRRGRGAAAALARWLTAAALLPLSYAFNLAVRDEWPSYRTLLALTATTAVLAFAALLRLADHLPARLGRPALTAVLALAAGASLFAGGTNLMRLLILPRIGEFDVLKAQLLHFDPARHRSVHVVRPERGCGLAPAAIYDEFGTASTGSTWVPEGMVRKAWAELQRPGPPPPVSQSGPDEDATPPEGALVIDMRQLYQLNPYWLRPREGSRGDQP
jgi:hypothetical protein